MNRTITKILGINLVIMAILLAIMIYPLKPEINIKEREARFRWLALYKDYTVYVDDNKEFTSPMVIKTSMRNYPLKLEPGVYFWKIKAGGVSSPTKRFTLDSDVSIKVYDNSLENDGNVDLNVSLKSITGAVITEVPYKGKMELEDNYNITAEQK